jgi:hypothetical protein
VQSQTKTNWDLKFCTDAEMIGMYIVYLISTFRLNIFALQSNNPPISISSSSAGFGYYLGLAAGF